MRAVLLIALFGAACQRESPTPRESPITRMDAGVVGPRADASIAEVDAAIEAPEPDLVPVEVAGLEDAVQLVSSRGSGRTCARRKTGHVVCWGQRYKAGDQNEYDPLPVEVPGLADAIDIGVSVVNACARRANRTVVCWGHVAPESERVVTIPLEVPALTGSSWLVDYQSTVCGVRAGKLTCLRGSARPFHDGGATASRMWSGAFARVSWMCWRAANKTRCEREISHRSGDQELETVTELGDLNDVVDMLVGVDLRLVCVVRASGSLECLDGFGGTFRRVLADVTSVAKSFQQTCALRRDGRVICWRGLPEEGKPQPIPALVDAVELVAGSVHQCARRSTGRVVCWGDGASLGNGVSRPP